MCSINPSLEIGISIACCENVTISGSGVHKVLVRLGISPLRDLDPLTGEQLRDLT